MARLTLAAALAAALALPALADPAEPVDEAPAARAPETPAAPEQQASERPAGPTQQACFGGLEDGQTILPTGASAGRFGGITARDCRANGGSALRALRSPAIAVGRPILS